MNLNSAASPGGGKTLNVSASVLRTYAGKSDTPRGDFAKADNDTMRETGQVPGTMKGFESDEAFKDLQERWRGQMRYLDGQLAGAAKALREAAKGFKAEDVRSEAEMARLAPPPLYGPFVPGTEPKPLGPYLPDGQQRSPYLLDPVPPPQNTPAPDATPQQPTLAPSPIQQWQYGPHVPANQPSGPAS